MTLDESNRGGKPASAAARPAGNPGLSPDMQTQVDRFRELRERGEHVRAQLAAASATARSASGAVTVTVGAGGVLERLELGEAARKLPLGKLADDILATYRHAAREVAEQGVEIMSTLVGPDSPTLQLIRDAIPAAAEADADREHGPSR
jgi:DNA-binding protein YbaB